MPGGNAPAYFVLSICVEYNIVAMISRKKLQEAEWAEIFPTTEAQKLLVHGLGLNAPLVKQELSDVNWTGRRIARDCLFPFLGITRRVSRYSALTGQDEEQRLDQMTAAKTKLLRKFPGTDDYDMGWCRTATFHTICIRTSTNGLATATARTTEKAEKKGAHCVSDQELVTNSEESQHYRLTLFNY